jgi:uncharacterized protein (DUF433 family)
MSSLRSSLVRIRRQQGAHRQQGVLRAPARSIQIIGFTVKRNRGITLSGGQLPLVERRPEVCSGALVFRGTRIPVDQVVGQLRRGVSWTEISEDYPALGPEALRYAQQLARQLQIPPR